MPFPSAVFGEFQAGASARVGGGMKAHPCYLFPPAGGGARRRLPGLDRWSLLHAAMTLRFTGSSIQDSIIMNDELMNK
jgi:hypothetical protein